MCGRRRVQWLDRSLHSEHDCCTPRSGIGLPPWQLVHTSRRDESDGLEGLQTRPSDIGCFRRSRPRDSYLAEGRGRRSSDEGLLIRESRFSSVRPSDPVHSYRSDVGLPSVSRASVVRALRGQLSRLRDYEKGSPILRQPHGDVDMDSPPSPPAREHRSAGVSRCRPSADEVVGRWCDLVGRGGTTGFDCEYEMGRGGTLGHAVGGRVADLKSAVA